jgi:hypothetical protein
LPWTWPPLRALCLSQRPPRSTTLLQSKSLRNQGFVFLWHVFLHCSFPFLTFAFLISLVDHRCLWQHFGRG